MFRCTKQIRIVQSILQSPQEKAVEWLDLLSCELGMNQERLIAIMFLSLKSRLNDASINRLHTFGQEIQTKQQATRTTLEHSLTDDSSPKTDSTSLISTTIAISTKTE